MEQAASDNTNGKPWGTTLLIASSIEIGYAARFSTDPPYWSERRLINGERNWLSKYPCPQWSSMLLQKLTAFKAMALTSRSLRGRPVAQWTQTHSSRARDLYPPSPEARMVWRAAKRNSGLWVCQFCSYKRGQGGAAGLRVSLRPCGHVCIARSTRLGCPLRGGAGCQRFYRPLRLQCKRP